MSTDTLELIDLEELLNEEVPCESKHVSVPHCSVKVVYRITGCRYSGQVCSSHVEDPLRGVRMRMQAGWLCEDCDRPARDCWKVVKI
jgi:hypothetical protein